MPLAPNERLDRARKFVNKYLNKELSEQPDSQTYWNKFFHIFGIERESVAVFERRAKRHDAPGRIDLFWPGTLIVEQKSPGKDLDAALDQAEQYFLSLPEAERPRYLIACDFKRFLLVDLSAKKTHAFTLAQLPGKLGLFGFMDGAEPEAHDEVPVSAKASRIMSEIYLRLKDTGYGSRDAGFLLTRLAYVFFADDTGVFSKNIFHKYVSTRTKADGSDLGPMLIQLFQILDTPVEKRQSNLDGDLAEFPYIDGALFEDAIQIPSMDSKARELLLKASAFDWNHISPSIFGSLFQSVLTAEEQHDAGAHYTTEENIMKVIGPLFLDDLRAELEKIKARKDAGRKNALEKFRDKLAGLNFLDPACGSGNFLITAYKHLRRLDLNAMIEIHDPKDKRLNAAAMPKINVNQFYGIELDGFSAKITETAMWMTDHISNNEVSEVYDGPYARIPLEKKANILNADALETDWNDVLPAAECSYVMGNPPFVGSKVMSEKQRAQVKRIAGLGGSGGTLDYVAAWFIRALKYAPDVGTSFVSTNSITQGEQVGQLWPILLKDHEITFAHRSFKWMSDVAGKAQVHVVVTGLAKKGRPHKKIFDGDEEENPYHVSPYLIGFDNAVPFVSESPRQLNDLPKMIMGSKPIDGGHYIFKADEREEFLALDPSAGKFLRPYVGAQEFINGGNRWILALHGAEPSELKAMPEVLKRIERVRDYRNGSTSKPTIKLAETPTVYHLNVIPKTPFLLIPRVSTSKRRYVPMGYIEPGNIPSDGTMIVSDANLGIFGLLVSDMHMIWLRRVGGRLGDGYRYSAGMVYNTFPLPDGGTATLDVLEPRAQAVLDARAAHPGQTLADLYDPLAMPPDLRRAHEKLDKAVDRLYRKEPFKDDHERLEFLLERYGAMVQKNQKLIPEPKHRRRRAKHRA